VTKGDLEEPRLYDMLQTQKTEDSNGTCSMNPSHRNPAITSKVFGNHEPKLKFMNLLDVRCQMPNT